MKEMRGGGGGGGVLLRGPGEPELPSVAETGTTMDTTASTIGRGSPPAGEPEFPSVVPLGTTMDTTGYTIVAGSTPELLSKNPDGLPLVLPTARGRTFLTMGGSRTHILDGDRKDSYLESHLFSKVLQIAIATTCILFGQRCPNFWQSDFTGRKVMRPGRWGGGYFNGLAR